MENRTLRISPDIAGFEYQYEDVNGKCVEYILFFCQRHEMKKELYNLNDLEMRKKLIAMGFVARVRDRQ